MRANTPKAHAHEHACVCNSELFVRQQSATVRARSGSTAASLARARARINAFMREPHILGRESFARADWNELGRDGSCCERPVSARPQRARASGENAANDRGRLYPYRSHARVRRALVEPQRCKWCGSASKRMRARSRTRAPRARRAHRRGKMSTAQSPRGLAAGLFRQFNVAFWSESISHRRRRRRRLRVCVRVYVSVCICVRACVFCAASVAFHMCVSSSSALCGPNQVCVVCARVRVSFMRSLCMFRARLSRMCSQ